MEREPLEKRGIKALRDLVFCVFVEVTNS